MKELLLQILDKCYEISTTTKADVFFSYSPHCNFYDVYYCQNGWNKDGEAMFINSSTKINIENLKDTIKELERITEEAN
ncbi:MAG: hypothetical protein HFJ30_10300 [Clostridia bacterium]|jgi:hypothetical protein|nr:hypothetical protein [Clostridia bacterium]